MNIVRKKERGFTLVELLIVVVILSILAAVIIPQLTGSTDDARVSALDTNLSSMRSSVEIYYVQHKNLYPGTIRTHKVGAAAPVAHTSAKDALLKQLLFYSDENGNTADTRTSVFKFGPYSKKGIPKNPQPNAATTTDIQKSDLTVDTATATIATASANDATATGWVFVTQTGEFFSNNSANETR